jgi:hypothetical protein
MSKIVWLFMFLVSWPVALACLYLKFCYAWLTLPFKLVSKTFKAIV